MLNRILISAATWAGLGLASGVYWRELTKFTHFTGVTQLSTAHTHALALGLLMLLAVLAPRAQVPAEKPTRLFVALWNARTGAHVRRPGRRGHPARCSVSRWPRRPCGRASQASAT